MERLVFRHRGYATLGALALAAGLFLFPATAASAVCMEHKSLVSYLSAKFSEVPRALGLVARKNVMEVYVSTKGTWTIVMTSAEGVSCIMAAGDTWEDIKVALADSPEY